MLIFVLIIGLFFLAIAVTMVARAVGTPAARSSETLDQIDAYGFAGTMPASVGQGEQVGFKDRMDSLTGAIGRWASSRFSRFQLPDYRKRLISAGMYNASPERLLGMQFLTALGATAAWIALGAVSDMAAWIFIFGLVAAVVLGWMAPTFIVDRKARKRREQIEKDLPDLIDLVVVTLNHRLNAFGYTHLARYDPRFAGSGNAEIFEGGADADTFVFTASFGLDDILDFTPGLDTLEFSTALFADATAVLAASIFHFGEHSVREAKLHMAKAGLPMRLDP